MRYRWGLRWLMLTALTAFSIAAAPMSVGQAGYASATFAAVAEGRRHGGGIHHRYRHIRCSGPVETPPPVTPTPSPEPPDPGLDG